MNAITRVSALTDIYSGAWEPVPCPIRRAAGRVKLVSRGRAPAGRAVRTGRPLISYLPKA